ncbi:unnamed protein product, partial [Owenia fusiformis]
SEASLITLTTKKIITKVVLFFTFLLSYSNKLKMSNANKNKMIMCDRLQKMTHFNKHEIEQLFDKFQCMCKLTIKDKPGKMDRLMFRDFIQNDFNMTDDILMDRVFKAYDLDNDSYISVEEWIKGLSVTLKGGLEEKIKHVFDVYDLNADGYISREEMFQMLKQCLVKQPTEEDPDEGIKDLVELALKKLDLDHDSKLSFKDFHDSISEEPLLLEAFGPCLPDEKVNKMFQEGLKEAVGNSR